MKYFSRGAFRLVGGIVSSTFLLLLLTASAAFAQSPPVWTRTFTGTGQQHSFICMYGSPHGNYASKDAAGNYFVPGCASGQTVVYKFDATSGAVLWASTFAGTGEDDSRMRRVAVDAAGDVIAVGSSSEINGNRRMHTIKYHGATGAVLWHAIHIETIDSQEGAGSIAFDAQGDVLVGGGVVVSGTYRAIVLKYGRANGNLLWKHIYSPLASTSSATIDVLLDNTGNVLVGGLVEDGGIRYHALWKLNAATGALIADRRGVQVGEAFGAQFRVLRAPDGAVFIGEGVSLMSQTHVRVVKYSPDGDLLLDVLRGEGHLHDMALDGVGNVLITGQAPGVTGTHVVLILKLRGDTLAQVWRQVIDGPIAGYYAQGFSLAADANGDVVAAVMTRDNGVDNSPRAIKLQGASGAVLWQLPFTPGVGGNARTVTPLADGSLLMSIDGQDGAGHPAFRAFKVTSTGQVTWSSTGTDVPTGTYLNAVAVSAAGDVAATGLYTGPHAQPVVSTALYDKAGAQKWRVTMNSPTAYPGTSSVAVDAAGNVVAMQTIYNPSGSMLQVTKYAAGTGGVLWTQAVLNPVFGSARSGRLAVHPDGGVVVVTSAGPAPGSTYGMMTHKFNGATGVLEWTQGPAHSSVLTLGEVVHIDASQRVIVVGMMTPGALNNYKIVVTAYSASGALLWSAVDTGPGFVELGSARVATDPAGNVFVTASLTDDPNRRDVLTIKFLAATGARAWGRRYDPAAPYSATAAGIVVNAAGDAFVAATLDEGNMRDTTGPFKVHLVKYAGNDGTTLFDATQAGGHNGAAARSIRQDINGDLLVAATMQQAPGGARVHLLRFGAASGNLLADVAHASSAHGIDEALDALPVADGVVLAGRTHEFSFPFGWMLTKLRREAAPGAPQNVVAFAGDGRITLSFIAPPDGGLPITAYTATCGAITASALQPPLTVTGLANNVNVSCTVVATNAFGSSTASAPVSATPAAGLPRVLVAAGSRRQHGAAFFDLPLNNTAPATGNIAIEPRQSAGGQQRVVLSFSDVLPAGLTATWNAVGQGAQPAGLTVSGADAEILVNGAADGTRITVTLDGLTAPVLVSLGVMLGDVTGTRAVTAADFAALRARTGPVNRDNFRFDLDLSGTVDAADLTLAKTRAARTMD